MTPPFAVVLVDKPEGPTSHDVVATLRRTFRTRRVGHTGTLDPFASGLLLVCVGPATRLVEYFHPLRKSYDAVVRFGAATDTDDRTGEIVSRAEVGPSLTRDVLERELAASRGRSEQVPPDFSARRSGGRRAYEAAREGRPLALEARPVMVDEAELLDWDPPLARVRYTVSTGTYIRALARDLGEAVGCPAHLDALRRTRIGPFAVTAADAPDAAAPGREATLRPAAALDWLPSRELTGPEAAAIGMGQAIETGRVDPAADAAHAVPDPDAPIRLLLNGDLIAMARRTDEGLAPEKVFRAA